MGSLFVGCHRYSVCSHCQMETAGTGFYLIRSGNPTFFCTFLNVFVAT